MPDAGGREGRRLSRQDWIGAARAALIRSGHAMVKVDRLAGDLNVTRGSFYWHFRDRNDLLGALLADWDQANSAAILDALAAPGSLLDRFRALVRIWIEEDGYSPAYDSAMRDWARVSPTVARTLAATDERRIAAFTAAFAEAGFEPDEALIRGRISYFHQVGYYAIGMRESRAGRKRYAELYLRVLTGAPLPG